MQLITLWAGNNKKIALFLVTTLAIIFCFYSVFLGTLWQSVGITFHPVLYALPFALSLSIIILYPSAIEIRRSWKSRAFFRKWKQFDLIMVLSFGLLFQYVGNQKVATWEENIVVESIDQLTANLPTLQVLGDVQTSGTKKGWFKKWLNNTKQALQSIAQRILPDQGNGARGIVIFLFVLLYIAYVFMSFVIAWAFCVLACNEYGLAAVAVLIGGVTVSLVGFYFAARALLRKLAKENKSDSSRKRITLWSILHTLFAFLSPIVVFGLLSILG